MSDGEAGHSFIRPPGHIGANLRVAAAFVGFVGAYVLGGKVGLALAQVHPHSTALWPGTGLAVAGLLLFGRAFWPAVTVGSFLVNYSTTTDALTSGVIAAGNTAEAYIIAFLLHRFGDGARSFERAASVFLFVGGVMFAAMLSATLGAGILWVADLAGPTTLPALWTNWWIGDIVGALVLAPPLVLWGQAAAFDTRPQRLFEAGFLLALIIVLGFVFTRSDVSNSTSLPTGFLTLPLIVWAAFRFTPREAATTTFLLAVGVVWNTQAGRGPYARGDQADSFLVLAMALGALAFVSLVLAALVADRRREAATLRAARSDLEGRVEERTQSLSVAVERLRSEITERERAEDNLRRSRASLEEAQHLAHLGSWEWDIASDRIAASDELARLYGLDPANVPTTFDGLLARVHEDDRERVRRAVTLARDMGTPLELEHRIRLPDGSPRWLHSQANVESGPDGRVARINGTAQDITERLRLERERMDAVERAKEVDRLQELNELKTRFMNTAAHELNTPLTPIRLQLHLLKNNLRGGEGDNAKRSLDVLERNIERMIGLVNDVLEASRLQAERLGMRKERVNLAEVAREAAESFQGPAQEAGLRLEATTGGPLWVEADPKRMSQVLYNLLSNAVKFTPRGGRVHVSARMRAGGAELRVEDNGIGLDREQIERLFQPFSQVHEATVTSRPGTGLGLYISRGIAELHGGSIRAESAGPGQGAAFVLMIPLAEDPPNRAGAA